MAGGVGLDIDKLSTTLSSLITLHGDVRRLKSRLASVRQNNSGIWPDLPSVRQFSAAYEQAIAALEAEIAEIEGTIESSRQALAESARSLEDQDAAVQARLTSLAARLDLTDNVPVAGTGPSASRPRSIS